MATFPHDTIARREKGECTSVTPPSVTARLEAARNPARWNPWLDRLLDRKVAEATALMKNTEERLW
jgi:hypothetical protein